MPGLKHHRLAIGSWAAAVMLLAACAGPWQSASGTLSAPRWSITVPDEWMHLSMSDAEMLSKDGPYLEYILIQSRPLEKGFRFTHQKMNAGMLPHEAAQLITDNMQSDPHIRRLRVLASEPVLVGDLTGFKLVYSYQDQYGVTIKTIYYGVVFPHMFFNMRFSAAQRHYFDKELPSFNKVLNSLRFVSAKYP